MVNRDVYNPDNLGKYNSMTMGKAGEYRVASELIMRGYEVFSPTMDTGTDLVLGDGRRIQVKTSESYLIKKPYEHHSYSFHFHKVRNQYKERKLKEQGLTLERLPNDLDGIDIAICWAVGDDDFYIIPAEQIRGKLSVSFTCDTDKRTQQKWNQWLKYKNNWDVLKFQSGVNLNDNLSMDTLLKNGKSKQIVENNEVTNFMDNHIEEQTCKQCGYKWIPLKENITRCPKCRHRYYLDKTHEAECKQCGYKWQTRIDPKRCYKCHSKYWNTERVIPKSIDEELVKKLYLDGKSSDAVAKEIGNNGFAVRKLLKKLGILRTVGESHQISWDKRKLLDNLPEVECIQCGHKWRPAKGKYRKCPNCNSLYWEHERMKEVECQKCHYIWKPMNKGNPRVCPKCGTTHWNDSQ